MRVLGIDPGTRVIGYGVIDSDADGVSKADGISLVECGALKSRADRPMGERLASLYEQISEIVMRHQPDAVAVESPFVGRNVKTALAIGKAQAIALLAGATRGIPTFEYTPAQIKQRVADYGTSSKEQVQRMVGLQLGLTEPPEPLDASDALATALCHLAEVHVGSLVEGAR